MAKANKKTTDPAAAAKAAAKACHQNALRTLAREHKLFVDTVARIVSRTPEQLAAVESPSAAEFFNKVKLQYRILMAEGLEAAFDLMTAAADSGKFD